MHATTSLPAPTYLASLPADFRWKPALEYLTTHTTQLLQTLSSTGAAPAPEWPAQPLLPPNDGPELSPAAQLLVLAALVPHWLPGFFDQLVREYVPEGGDLPEFGGVRGTQHRGLLPTGETALFLLAGTDAARRLACLPLLGPEGELAQLRLLHLEALPAAEPPLSGRLLLTPDYAELLSTGRVAAPQLGAGFPAQRLRTALEWDDLVLPAPTRAQINDVEHWLRHHQALRTDWGLQRHLKPGYRVLFYGPPGTGKTMTATLLGKAAGRDVFRVDLSLVTSKYIGETEKNLGTLFDRAAAKDWILFFDEADALFGKRTDTRDAHDRYANQEVAFLLQRIEEHDGLVILASNLKGNLDPAFARRFQAMVHFPVPTVAERLQLWQKSLPADRAPAVRLEELASRYELSGASILNVVQFAALRALGRGAAELAPADVQEAIRLEYHKEGRLL